MNKVLYILNGPNLNLLGRRETKIYGTESMESVLLGIQRQHPDFHLRYLQSNHEGDLIDWLQQAAEPDAENGSIPTLGIVINAGGLTHTSVCLRDTIQYVREQDIPVIEVHISDISRREDFRRISLLTPVCSETIMGIGTKCYEKAVNLILSHPHTC